MSTSTINTEQTERAIKRAQLKILTHKVKELLTEDARYRDNDALLVNRIQRDEMIELGLDVNLMTLNEFFRIRLEKRISSGDSITRIRREVQEYYAETRGDKYKKRQSKQADVVSDLHVIEDHINDNKKLQAEELAAENEGNILTGAPTVTEFCDHCQGTGKYESHPCNVCNGTGEVQFK